MIRASIDLGTNTCLLLIVEWDPQSQQIVRVVHDEATVVRLGEGVDRDRKFKAAPMERTLNCLKRYSEKVLNAGGLPNTAVCVGTSQARDASNSAEFFSEIQKQTGFQFQVISGEEEAKYTFLGALLPQMNPKSSVVIDIGGGSTELISLDQSQSIDMGSVRFTERFLKSDPVTDDEFWKCQEVVDAEFNSLMGWRQSLPQDVALVGVAGTVTTLAAWHLGLEKFDPKAIDSLSLFRGDIHRMVEELKWRTLEERRAIPGIEPLRADVLLAGALILWRAMEILKFSECKVSTRGLRFGILNAQLK